MERNHNQIINESDRKVITNEDGENGESEMVLSESRPVTAVVGLF